MREREKVQNLPEEPPSPYSPRASCDSLLLLCRFQVCCDQNTRLARSEPDLEQNSNASSLISPQAHTRHMEQLQLRILILVHVYVFQESAYYMQGYTMY